MITLFEIMAILLVGTVWAILAWHAQPRRDVCTPPSNQERLLHYIDRRARWECEQRKRKLLQRQRVERMLEERWLRRAAPAAHSGRGPTVPRPFVMEDA